MLNLIKLLVIVTVVSLTSSRPSKLVKNDKKFSLILKFACKVSHEVAESHPETSAIAVIASENDFPLKFHDQLLNCLPQNIPKVVSTFKENIGQIFLTSSAFVIFVADKIDKVNFKFKTLLTFEAIFYIF